MSWSSCSQSWMSWSVWYSPDREFRDRVAPNRECRDRFDFLPIANFVIELLPIASFVINSIVIPPCALSSFSSVFNEPWSSWLKLWTWQDCLNISQSHPGHSKHCSSPPPSALLNFTCARTLCWRADCIGEAIASARQRRHSTPARAFADPTIGVGQAFPCREYKKCFTDNCWNWWIRG